MAVETARSSPSDGAASRSEPGRAGARTPDSSRPRVGPFLDAAAAYSWRFLVTAAAVALVALIAARLWVVTLAVFLSLMGTALLRPAAQWLGSRGWRPAAAAGVVLVAAVTSVATVALLAVPPFVAQIGELGRNLGKGVDQLGDWLANGPLNLSQQQLDEYAEAAGDEVSANSDALVRGVLSGAQIAGELLVVAALSLVLTFFFIKDGDRISDWLVGLLPRPGRGHGREVARRSWAALAGTSGA